VRKEKEKDMGKILKWGTLAATIFSLFYFRGDLQRYAKMKMM
jgi:hypothetical protein